MRSQAAGIPSRSSGRDDPPPAERWSGARSGIVIGCFFLSGCAALIAEICWIRIASLVFGSTTIALSTVLAVFFGGLAIGSAIFGYVSQRTTRPLRLYAIIEIILGACVVATLFLFTAADAAYGALFRAFDGAAGPVSIARVALVALVLLPPTILMGATLPLFCRQFVVRIGRISGSVGFLYGVNTLGAAVGCALAGFVLIPMIGVTRSILLAATINMLVGAVVFTLSRTAKVRNEGAMDRREVAPRQRMGAADDAAFNQPQARFGIPHLIIGLLFFATGFIALGAQVIWTRFLALLVPNTVHTYTITVTVVLAGIVAGTWLTARIYDRAVPRAFVFGSLQIATGLLLLFTLMLPADVWRGLGGGPGMYATMLLPIAILSGASFPLAIRMVLHHPARAGLGVGTMSAVNTAGGIAGAMAAGFIGLPLLGLELSIRTLSAIGVASGIIAWFALSGSGYRHVQFLTTLVVIAAWMWIPFATGTRMPADYLADRDELVAYREGLMSNLAVIRSSDVLRLEIDRWWQGEDRKNHQFMAGHIPTLLHNHPRRVLVVGIGTGQTAARFLMHDIDRLDVVDIEPALIEFIPKHFDSAWMDDERVRLIDEDGRNFITHTGQTYDIISLEVGQLFRPGIAAFYTEDFYRRAADRLEQGGVLAQFVPLTFLTMDEFRSVIRSFIEVMPQSMLWYNTSELLLLGVKADRFSIDPKRYESAIDNPALREDLQYSYWGGRDRWLDRIEVFFAGFLCGPGCLATLAADAPSYRDDRPVLEYATARPRRLARNEIPIVEAMRPHLEGIETVLHPPLAPEQRQTIHSIQTENVNDMLAHANLRVVEIAQPPLEPRRAIELLAEAIRLNPANFASHLQLANELIKVQRFDEAGEHLRIALEIRPDDPLANRGMGYLLLRDRRFDEAAAHLRITLRSNPRDASAHNYLGAALAQMGDIRSARDHFQQAARLRPDDPGIAANLAQAQRALAGDSSP